jgi:cupin 2 domain-containing protein
MMNTVFDITDIDFSVDEEITDLLISSDDIRIERIISFGQITAPDCWYDQTQNEFVLLLQGEARIVFEDGKEIHLTKGNYIEIPAHLRHRVSYTSDNPVCIWITVFFSSKTAK